MAELLSLPINRATSATGAVLSGAKLRFSLTGTTTPADVYTTAARTTAHSNPVVADAGGLFPAIYTDPSISYRARLFTALDVLVADFDPIDNLDPGAAVSVLDTAYGAVGDGVTNDTAAIAAALATGKDVYIPSGYTFAITNLTGFQDNQRIYGGGAFKKFGTDINGLTGQMILLPDGSDGVTFDGIEFDGNRGVFNYGDPVPAILGYLTKSLNVVNCYFHDIIDVGIKLRDGARLYASGNRFINTMENGIQIDHQAIDVRTGLAYTGSRPAVQGNHTIIGNFFKGITRIEDGTLVDGNGVALLAQPSSAGHRNVKITNNAFEDCLRGVQHETNDVAMLGRGIVVDNNSFENGVAGGTAEGIYGKVGVAFVNVAGGSISGNTMRNIGNHDLVGLTTAGIYITSSSDNIRIHGNNIYDNSGLADRTEYGICLVAGTNIDVRGNYGSGMRTEFIGKLSSSPSLSNVVIESNTGGSLDETWGNVVAVEFRLMDLAASANTDMLVGGVAGMDDWVVPANGRIVGMSARLSSTPVGGSISIKAYVNAVEHTAAALPNSAFAGGSRASTRIAATAAPQITAGQRLGLTVTTGSLNPGTTVDIVVHALIDFSVKQ